jgi:hypothetical protein
MTVFVPALRNGRLGNVRRRQRARRTDMGLVPATAGNPFTKLDRQGVIGAFRSCGSRDPDVLLAQKQQFLAPAKHLKLLGLICLVIGAFFTVTVILAIAGIPAMVFGWWVQRFGHQNMQTIEAAYADFLASAHM